MRTALGGLGSEKLVKRKKFLGDFHPSKLSLELEEAPKLQKHY
jgi:hypothetical protein